MPELPEVEICARALASRLCHARIHRVEVRDNKIRLPANLVGRRIRSVTRRAKHILIGLDDGRVILVHLGMTGWIEYAPPKRYRVAFHTSQASAYLEDSRRFGRVQVVTAVEADRHLAKLGREPLSSGFSLDRVCQTRRPIKVALMDQRLIAGVGNIYASESLFRARLHPAMRADRLTMPQRQRLQRAIVTALRLAIRRGERIFTMPKQFHVYDREGHPCHRCHHPIRRIVQAHRSTFYCPHCQAAQSRRRKSRSTSPVGSDTKRSC